MPIEQKITCKSSDGRGQINLVSYPEKDGRLTYVTQVKRDGKEIMHMTKHPDGTRHTTVGGKRIK